MKGLPKKSESPIRYEEGVVYYKKFPQWVRDKYHEVIKGKCQLCGKEISKYQMQIHRVLRGIQGGLYTLCKLDHPKQNCKFICEGCHKLIHSNEFGHVSHSY